jgi:probable rRNA maturation factor
MASSIASSSTPKSGIVSSRASLTVDIRGRAGRLRALTPSTVRTLKRLVGRAMRAAGVAERAMALSLSDDHELLALNRQYAGEDHATDVLSFEQSAPLLGDVVISVETAARQAAAAGHSLTAELVHLAVHGLVHLMGFDHATKAEERVMFGYEAKLRAAARAPGEVKRVRAPTPTARRRRRA